jgi:glycosyltransferase involved in cell wall biosynthesis
LIKVSKNSEPLFSVILTTYNRNYLAQRAINSLINQTMHNWELIIVDDGSTDSSYQTLIPECLFNDKIRYIFHSNRKQAYSKNTGIIASTGKYVTFLDSDDEYLPNHLESREKILLKYPEIDLLHGGIEIIGSQFVPDMRNTSKMIHLSKCVASGTFFCKREKALQIGGFDDIEYGDDTVFFDKCLNSNLVIYKTDIKTYKYYRNIDDSICNRVNFKK